MMKRPTAWLGDVAKDTRYALRMLGRSPGFAAVAIATLAVGIGANTAVFSLTHRLLLAPLPVHQPSQLFVVSRSTVEQSRLTEFPHLFFRTLAEDREVFDGVLSRGGSERVTVSADAGGEPAIGELVSGTYFEVLGVAAHLGRVLTPADDMSVGAHPVVVLSHDYWRRRFAADPSVIGSTIRLSGYPMTIVGVSPAGFDGLDPGQKVDVRIPLSMQAEVRRATSTLQRPDVWEFNIVARLKQGVSIEHAQRALSMRFERYSSEAPGGAASARGGSPAMARIELLPAVTGFGNTRARFAVALSVLLAITTGVLVVACVNVANLLLARSAARRQEVAIRRAVGAGTGRLLRQLLTESMVLSLLGAAAGVLVAVLGAPALVYLLSGTGARLELETRLEAPVLFFHLGISVLSGVLFGLAPAFGARRDLMSEFRLASSRGSSAMVRASLVAAQVMLAVVVLVAAVMFVRTVHALRVTDLGFASDHLLLVALDPKTAGRSDTEVAPFFRAVRERVRALPGVRDVSFSTVRVLSNSLWSGSVAVEGASAAEPGSRALRDAVGPGYFRTLGIPLLSGREFTEGDDERAERVAIVNDSFARRYFGGRDPLGKKVGAALPNHVIVGVAADTRSVHVREAPAPAWYIPYEQRPGLKHLNLIVRTSADPGGLVSAVRAAVAAVDPRVAMFEVRTQEAQIDQLLLVERTLAVLATFFAVLGGGLAAVGLYGVLAFLVEQRRKEIGLRIALGGRPATVAWMVVGSAWPWVAIGLFAGLAAAAALGRYAKSVLYGVDSIDASSLVVGAVTMAAIAGLALVVPARRAARVDPMAILRE